MKHEPSGAKAGGVLSRDEAIEAINNSELFSDSEKELLFKMLNENLIELFRNYESPREVLIAMTRKAINNLLSSNLSQASI